MLDSLRDQPGGTHPGPSIPQPLPCHGRQVNGSRGTYLARRCRPIHGTKSSLGVDPICSPARLLHRHTGRAASGSMPCPGVSHSALDQRRPGSHRGSPGHVLLFAAAAGRLRLSARRAARSMSAALARQSAPPQQVGGSSSLQGLTWRRLLLLPWLATTLRILFLIA